MDHIRDSSLLDLNDIHNVYDLPDFVKHANRATKEDVDRLPSTSFAYPDQRLYPVHTPEDTWQSAAYFQKHASEFSEDERQKIANAISGAIRFWGIENTFVLRPQQEKEAAELTKVVYRDGDRVLASVSVHDAHEFLKVAADVATHRETYPWAVRMDLAHQLLQAPDELTAVLPSDVREKLEKTAGLQMAKLATVRRELALRKAWYDHFDVDPEDQTGKLAKEAAETAVSGFLPPSFLLKVAGVVDHLDRLASIHGRYHQDVLPPEDMFNGVTSSAGEMFKSAMIRLPDGSYLPTEELEKKAEKITKFLENVCNEKVAGDLRAAVTRISVREAVLLHQVLKES